MKKICFLSATSGEDVVTSVDFVCISSRILRRHFSVSLSSSLERLPAVLLTEPAMCAFLYLDGDKY